MDYTIDGNILSFKYYTPSGSGRMEVDLSQFFKNPSIKHTKKLLKTVDLCLDRNEVKTELNKWITNDIDGRMDPDSGAYERMMRNAYIAAREGRADAENKVKKQTALVKRMEDHIRLGKVPKKSPEREALKVMRADLKAYKQSLRNYEKEVKTIPRTIERDRKKYETLKKVKVLVGGTVDD